MTELDERLAEALREAVPEPPRQLDPEAIRYRSGGRPRTLRRYAPGLAAAAVIAIAVGITLTRGSGGAPAGNRGPSVESQQPSALFTARVVLDQTTAPANGEPITGYVIVYNESNEPITISDACNGWAPAVGLTNDQVPFDPGFGGVGCASDTVPVGTTRFPIRVSTTLDQCAEPGGQPPTPACVGPDHNQMPNLPPGEYTTKVIFQDLSQDPTLEAPVHVTLTAP